MKVVLGADKFGYELMNVIKEDLQSKNIQVIEIYEKDDDFVDVTVKVAKKLDEEKCMGIVVDGYACGPFMVASKIKGMIAAQVSEERTGYMTRSHNNARMICIGQEIVGKTFAKNIVEEFLNGQYAGGRHQIRVDMLNKMC